MKAKHTDIPKVGSYGNSGYIKYWSLKKEKKKYWSLFSVSFDDQKLIQPQWIEKLSILETKKVRINEIRSSYR